MYVLNAYTCEYTSTLQMYAYKLSEGYAHALAVQIHVCACTCTHITCACALQWFSNHAWKQWMHVLGRACPFEHAGYFQPTQNYVFTKPCYLL